MNVINQSVHKGRKAHNYKRSIEAIMKADFVRLVNEAPIRWPISNKTLYRYEKEGRIKTIGSPKMIDCVEFESQLKLGFPVIKSPEE